MKDGTRKVFTGLKIGGAILTAVSIIFNIYLFTVDPNSLIVSSQLLHGEEGYKLAVLYGSGLLTAVNLLYSVFICMWIGIYGSIVVLYVVETSELKVTKLKQVKKNLLHTLPIAGTLLAGLILAISGVYRVSKAETISDTNQMIQVMEIMAKDYNEPLKLGEVETSRYVEVSLDKIENMDEVARYVSSPITITDYFILEPTQVINMKKGVTYFLLPPPNYYA